MPTTYHVSSSCTFRLDSAASVEATPGPGLAPRRLPAELASLLLQLGAPRSAPQIHRISGARSSLPELTRVLEQLCDEGLLVRGGGPSPACGPSLAELLRRDVAEDPQVLARIGECLRQGRLVVIRDALPSALAERVHAELEAAEAWSVAELHAPCFGYRRHTVSNPADLPPTVSECAALFDSPATKDFIGELSGLPCDGEALVVPSWFQPGDYISPHEDCGDGRRTVAYVWHLTRGWDPRWGGHLVWYPTGTQIEPGFNRLVLFAVGRGRALGSLHSVSTVSAHARQRRLAIGGWWHRPGAAEARPPSAESQRAGDEGMSPHRYGPPRIYLGEDEPVTIL
ncbi:MAG: 2OG-Fe(II) oxygenase [Myxococcales bacterium]|nr:2OG-Fe(II) oxygenase [Myxococcales bacterium]